MSDWMVAAIVVVVWTVAILGSWGLLREMDLDEDLPGWIAACVMLIAPAALAMLAVLWIISRPGDRRNP